MKRVLIFDGPTAVERFQRLASLKDLGIQECIEKRERTLDDVDSQADLDEAFQAIGVRFAEAKALGTADAELVEAEKEIEAQSVKDGRNAPFWPRTQTGAHMLFLRPSAAGDPPPRLILEDGGTYKFLVRMIEKAAPRANGSLAITIRDLRRFLATAPASSDGILPADVPASVPAKEPIEQT